MQLGEELIYIKSTSDFKLSLEGADRYVQDVKNTYLGLLSCSDETGWPYEDEDDELDPSRIWQIYYLFEYTIRGRNAY